MDLLINLLKQMEDQAVVDFAEAEQDFTTGEVVSSRTQETKKLTRKAAWKQLQSLLGKKAGRGAAAHTLHESKLRVVLIFAATMGGMSAQEKDTVRRLLTEAHPEEPDFEQWLEGLQRLRITTSAEATPWYKRSKRAKTRVRLETGGDDDDSVYALSRTVPRVQGLAASLLDGTLPEDEFPFMHTGGAPTLSAPQKPPAGGGGGGGKSRRRSPSWASAAGEGLAAAPALDDLKSAPRVHIFVVGGVTPAEIAAVAALQKETRREIVIGGTNVLTPQTMLRELPALAGRTRA